MKSCEHDFTLASINSEDYDPPRASSCRLSSVCKKKKSYFKAYYSVFNIISKVRNVCVEVIV